MRRPDPTAMRRRTLQLLGAVGLPAWPRLATGATAAPLGAPAPSPAMLATPATPATPPPGAGRWPGVPHRHPPADPLRRLAFPRDFGAHPDFRTEWWYATGWLTSGSGSPMGFQVTFFRVRTTHPAANPSRFAPTQLLFAHAALMVPARARPLHAQRAARLGTPGARLGVGDTDVAIGDWTFARDASDRYRTRIAADDFALDLVLVPPDPAPWLQGDDGFSRKGPQPGQASHYYSRPQLAVDGSVRFRSPAPHRGSAPGGDGPATAGAALPVRGTAWFDHEWSTTVLDPSAEGWDWTGINFDDGSALVAFRIRRKRAPNEPDRDATLWSDAARWFPDGRRQSIGAVEFTPTRTWRSPRSGARYPVALRIRGPGLDLALEPLFDDQELDGRTSTGVIYWEGAVVASSGGSRIGAGYLELTGYQAALRL